MVRHAPCAPENNSIKTLTMMAMKEQLSPKQVAQAIGVSEASLKRWCDKGFILSTRTAGGHRRIPISGVLKYLRDSGHPLIDPRVLGLPSATGSGDLTLVRSVDHFAAAFEVGDLDSIRRVMVNLYLAGHRMCEIFDKAATPAFHRVGDLWAAGKMEIYQERRACEVFDRAICELKTVLAAPNSSARLALGGTFEADPYTVPTTMAEVSMYQVGWRAQSLGTGLPAETLAAAIAAHKPALFWLSVSTFDSRTRFLSQFKVLARAAIQHGCAVVVGGRALTEEVRREMDYAAYGDTMRHLTSFAESLAAHHNESTSRNE